MEREVRYCTTQDGVRIAYAVEGSGPPLVICPYFFESFSRDGDAIGDWSGLLRGVGEGRRVFRYDMRGTGLSQREDAEISHDAFLLDLEAVVSAAGLEKLDLMAWVMTGPTAIEFAAGHPDSVNRMVLYSAFARYDEVMPADTLKGLAALCRSNWRMASQTFTDMSLREHVPEKALRLAEVLRETVSAEVVASAMESTVDVTECLAAIAAPTLVLHRVNDSAMPFATSQKLAASIPNARLAPLSGTINYPALGDRQEVVDAINAFLKAGEPEPSEPAAAEPSGFRTILFTDIVGHTAMTQRLGDAEAREVLREHERITRDELKSHGGSEVKTMGDGFMASFSSATKALDCAVAVQRAFAERNESAAEPILVRVGINAGEPIAEDDDLFGSAVIAAARIAAKADGGEILTSDTVRGILAGKGFLFSDRGDVALRGFEDPMRLYEVNWRQSE